MLSRSISKLGQAHTPPKAPNIWNVSRASSLWVGKSVKGRWSRATKGNKHFTCDFQPNFALLGALWKQITFWFGSVQFLTTPLNVDLVTSKSKSCHCHWPFKEPSPINRRSSSPRQGSDFAMNIQTGEGWQIWNHELQTTCEDAKDSKGSRNWACFAISLPGPTILIVVWGGVDVGCPNLLCEIWASLFKQFYLISIGLFSSLLTFRSITL